MKILKLNKNFTLGAEPLGRRIRLIVYKDRDEYVCRKEFINKLEKFVKSKDTNIFKGRLQLHKVKNEICVVVKGESLGNISTADFKKLIIII